MSRLITVSRIGVAVLIIAFAGMFAQSVAAGDVANPSDEMSEFLSIFKGKDTVVQYENFIKKYPNSQFRPLAESRISQLSGQGSQSRGAQSTSLPDTPPSQEMTGGMGSTMIGDNMTFADIKDKTLIETNTSDFLLVSVKQLPSAKLWAREEITVNELTGNATSKDVYTDFSPPDGMMLIRVIFQLTKDATGADLLKNQVVIVGEDKKPVTPLKLLLYRNPSVASVALDRLSLPQGKNLIAAYFSTKICDPFKLVLQIEDKSYVMLRPLLGNR